LMIVQHCIDDNIELWTFDKHFQLMAKHTSLKLMSLDKV
jgi:predicted nucleic acid-binding protein